MERIFDTPETIDLYVQIGSGSVTVHASDTTSTTVSIAGRRADDVEVSHEGRQVAVIAPRERGVFGDDSRLDVEVTVPAGSNLATKTGSATLTTQGILGHADVNTGSGGARIDTLTAPAEVKSGSGEIAVDSAAQLQVKVGSGDVRIDQALGDCAVSTGSGDVRIGSARAGVLVKTGSGDLLVQEAEGDLRFSGASGDVSVGRFHRGGINVKNVSGDIHIGIPAGVPVWTDCTTLTGKLRSDLAGAGEPTAGQDHIELRAKTTSGDITLAQL